jgi:hypothetical protein
MHSPENSGVRRPAELSAQWHQELTARRPAAQILGPAICAPRFGGAHRLVHPVRGFNRIGWKPPVRQVFAEPGVNPRTRLLAAERKIALCKSSSLVDFRLPSDQRQTVGCRDE